MIVVRFFFSFCSSENCSEVFRRWLQWLDIPQWGNDIRFTDGDNYTHAVILNVAMPSLYIPKENVLGLAFEPPVFLKLSRTFVDYAKQYIGKYYIGEKGNLPDPFVEHQAFMWHVPVPQQIEAPSKLISIIFSTKHSAPGHKYRHQLVQAILQSDLPIDIYGNGCQTLVQSKDKRIKGAFHEVEPYKGYQFSIAIENYALPAYISEKFTNCLMYEATPIYYGCSQIDHYFPNTSLRLSGNVEFDMNLLANVCAQPSSYRKSIDRWDIIKKMCLIDHLLQLWKV